MSIESGQGQVSSFRNYAGFIGALVASLGAFGVYWLTIAPTIQGFDSAELTVGAIDLGFVHPTGYPLYILVGHLFSKLPVGSIAFRLNLMSSVFGSLTILVLYLLIYQQKRQWLWSLALVALFGLTPVFWSQAIRAEVYTLHTFLMVATLYCWYNAYRSKHIAWYAVCFLLLGLGLANHMTTIWLWLSILIASFSFNRRWKWITLWGTLAGLLIAFLIYLYFPMRSQADLNIDYIRPYFGIDFNNLSSLAWLVTGRAFRCFMNLPTLCSQLGSDLQSLAVFFLTGSLGLGIIFSFFGWKVLRQEARIWNRLLTIYLLFNIFMFLAYQVIDKEVMIIPAIMLICIWSANGLDPTINAITTRWKLRKPDKVYTGACLILFLAVGLAAALDWQDVSLWGDTRVYSYASRILVNARPDTVIVNHWPTASVFDYIQLVEGKRLDVESFNIDFYFLALGTACDPNPSSLHLKPWFDWIDANIERRPLCFIEPLPPISAELSWQKQGDCWIPLKGQD